VPILTGACSTAGRHIRAMPSSRTAASDATRTGTATSSTTGPASTTTPSLVPDAPVTGPATVTHPTPGAVTAIGDSVMIDATGSLQASIPGIVVDAAVSRQVGTGIDDVQSRAASGTLGQVVVFGLGTNGTFSVAAFQQLVAVTAGRTLVVITSHCPYCKWTDANNAMISADCNTATHCRIADFEALADRNPGWFTADGVHLPSGGAGAQAYAEVVRASIAT